MLVIFSMNIFCKKVFKNKNLFQFLVVLRTYFTYLNNLVVLGQLLMNFAILIKVLRPKLDIKWTL